MGLETAPPTRARGGGNHGTRTRTTNSARPHRGGAAPNVDPDLVRAAVLDTALDGIVTIDEHGDVREFNSAAEQMFGYKRSEVIGHQMVEKLVPPDLRSAHTKGFGRYLETGVGRILGHSIDIEAM